MTAKGTNAPSNVDGSLTTCTQQITMSTADVLASAQFTCGIIRRVVPQANGTVFLQRTGDATAVSYVAFPGQPIDGEFTLIGGTTNYPTASTIVLNLEM